MSAYILVFIFQMYGGGAPTSALSVEFGDEKSCQVALQKIWKQATMHGRGLPVAVCVQKAGAK